MIKRLTCLFKGHVPVKIVITWTSKHYSHKRQRFTQRRNRKSWVECEQCGKKLENRYG